MSRALPEAEVELAILAEKDCGEYRKGSSQAPVS
jgi:hypothetical protein